MSPTPTKNSAPSSDISGSHSVDAPTSGWVLRALEQLASVMSKFPNLLEQLKSLQGQSASRGGEDFLSVLKEKVSGDPRLTAAFATVSRVNAEFESAGISPSLLRELRNPPRK